MPHSRLHDFMAEMTQSPKLKAFAKRALLTGYENMRLPRASDLVDEIFRKLEKWDRATPIEDVFENIRISLSFRWHGSSVRKFWSSYYKSVEAPFITGVISPLITGNKILEIGTGRGWISYHLAKSFPELMITQTDVVDYREPEVQQAGNLSFVAVTGDNPLPFQAGSFETAVVVYVLPKNCVKGYTFSA